MNRYLIETSHNREDCICTLPIRRIRPHYKFEWGCESGVCMGWAIIEAGSVEEALMSVPSLVRSKLRL